MSNLKLGVIVLLLAVGGFAGNAMAEELPPINTTSGPVLGFSSTLSQSAVFAAFLSDIGGGSGADTAISVSNILVTPPKIAGVNDGGDTMGGVTVYLYAQDGNNYVFKTGDNPMVGSGLDSNGQLGPGRTWTVLMSDIMGSLGVDNFLGFGFFVADFDGVTGTYTNFFSGIGSGFGAVMQSPSGGTPVDTSKEH